MKVKIQKTIEKNVTIPKDSDLGKLLEAFRPKIFKAEIGFDISEDAIELVLFDNYGNECIYYFDKETFETVTRIPETEDNYYDSDPG